ncbi:MAG: hypothetical protein ACLRMX_05325 [Lachnospira eligens]
MYKHGWQSFYMSDGMSMYGDKAYEESDVCLINSEVYKESFEDEAHL